jgi:hypothetical protein
MPRYDAVLTFVGILNLVKSPTDAGMQIKLVVASLPTKRLPHANDSYKLRPQRSVLAVAWKRAFRSEVKMPDSQQMSALDKSQLLPERPGWAQSRTSAFGRQLNDGSPPGVDVAGRPTSDCFRERRTAI